MDLAKRWILSIAIASVTVPAYAGEQEKAVGAADTRTSKAVRLSDAELDQITAAGATTQDLLIINPGNASQAKIPGNSGHAITIFGGIPNTTGVMTIANPAQTFTRCISVQGGC